MRHNDARHAKLPLRLDDEVVDLRRRDGVKPRTGLIVEDDGRVDGNGTRQAHALLHAAGKLSRHHALAARKTYELQFLAHDALDLRLLEPPVLAQSEGDVLADGHGIEERRILKAHAHLEPHHIQLGFRHLRDLRIADPNPA